MSNLGNPRFAIGLLGAGLLLLVSNGCRSTGAPGPSSVTAAGALPAHSSQPSDPTEIPFEKFVLDNGLTLIVHEDHKAPIVAVNVWYHVGSKNEKPARTGLAHLFEHLMFNGSEHFDDDYFKALDRVGATDLNGTTNADRTNYFQNVPTSALETVLWLESDRMGHLLGAITQERLDEQRGVVQNEKRQSENQPYGGVWNALGAMAYPEGHPYSWPTIGSMEDLDATSLENVHDWFRQYYGAANAVIAVAGDVDAERVQQLVRDYFGDIPAGPPLERDEIWVAERAHEKRRVIEDRVPQARLIKAWNVPQLGTIDGDYLNLVSDLLGAGKNSRLYERLVYDDQIATDVAAFVWLREIGGLFVIWATAQPGQDLSELERAMDEEVARFLADGPTSRELERVKSEYRAEFIRGIERIGGFGGKSDILARSEVFGDSPDAYREQLQRTADATRNDLQRAAERWLSQGAVVLEVRPFPERKTVDSPIDRSALPEPGPWPEPTFPKLQRTTLSNGLEVILAERHAVPLVLFDLLIDAGYAADAGGALGTAMLALDMLDEGTERRNGLEISEELSRLGATLEVQSNLDVSSLQLTALTENLAPSLDLYADVILNPAFAEVAFRRQQKQQLAAIAREKSTPMKMALRVFPPLLYGEDHAYGIPFTGSGTETAVASLEPEDLRRFHQTWFKPNHAVLVVVGDTTLASITPLLEAAFRDWAPGPIPDKRLSAVEQQDAAVVYLIDRPDSQQSTILAGHVAPPKANPDEVAIEAMNEVFGGSFSARLNMNLREDKHWSYGARSFLMDARGQRPFIAYASVQTDKTADAMAEIQRELQAIRGSRPPTLAELEKAIDLQTLTLPGRWETGAAVAESIAELVRFGFPDDYWADYPDRVRSLQLARVVAAANEVLEPDRLIWVVVGDRSEIEPGIRALGLGEIRLLGPDGRVKGS